MKKKYDIIIVGAGPAGLAAAISAKKDTKLNILVLEKQIRPGNRIRGETLRYDKSLEENVFYPGFFDKITVNKTNKYRFYSASTKKNIELEALNERHMIKWHDLIDALIKKAIEDGIEIQANHEVTDLLFEGDKYSGIKVFDGFKNLQVKSDLIILADGCENSLINKYGFQTPKENYPILKIIAENVSIKENVIELFFSTGKDIPPGILSVFPRSRSSAEANYVQFADLKIKDLLFWWERLKSETPIFSDYFKNSSILYFDVTKLPFGGPTKEVLIPKPRIFMAGDNAGHVQATSGAGLVTTMSMGHEIGKIASEIYNSGEIDSYFSADAKKQIMKKIKKTNIYRNLKDTANLAIDIRRAFFKTLVTPEKIDEKWDSLIAPSFKGALKYI
ncbi:MAG: FAD-binding protein [Candidatus Helarchaeota archaeon]|nr:FAD-binding protein [Candidatus Helarchaeota archaeon]